MKLVMDFSDSRYKGACIHCGASWTAKTSSEDHVPTKALLDRNLPATLACAECGIDVLGRGVPFLIVPDGSGGSVSSAPPTRVSGLYEGMTPWLGTVSLEASGLPT